MDLKNLYYNCQKFNLVPFCLVTHIAISTVFYTGVIYFMFKYFMNHSISGTKTFMYIHKNVHLNISCDHTFLDLKNSRLSYHYIYLVVSNLSK